jgi:hypothetical protein
MKRFRVHLACTAAGIMLSACTQGATGPPGITSVNPLTSSKLQMVVGTANIEGTAGLNVVTTLRQSNGDSAVLVDTPSLSGPFTFGVAAAPGGTGVDAYSSLNVGPSLQEFNAGNVISGTLQTVRAGTPACDTVIPVGGFVTCPSGVPPNTTTFGQSGGVFGMGFAPYNSTINGVAASYTPFPDGLYDTTGDTFTPWGGPPAFDPNKDGMGIRDGQFDIVNILGIGMGITAIENVTPSAGTYNLSVVIPTSPTSSGTISTTASLTSTALLGAAAPPAGFVEDGLGGVTMTVTFPAGVTEGYVEIEDIGVPGAGATCQGPTGTVAFPVYYTIHMTAPGTATLPDTDGPNTEVSDGPGDTQASESICTSAANTAANGGTATAGDEYGVWFIGMDYPLYAASPTIGSASQTPTLAGAGGQADITTSPVVVRIAAAGTRHSQTLHRTKWSQVMKRYNQFHHRHR